MRDIFPTLERWVGEGHRFALATVTNTWGSSPRPVGSMMGVREDGLICGSVSGGCVESAVIESALASLADGQHRQLHFGQLTDDEVWDVGLSCGGEIDVWIDPLPVQRDRAIWDRLAELVKRDEPFTLVTLLVWGSSPVPGATSTKSSGPIVEQSIEAFDPASPTGMAAETDRAAFVQPIPSRDKLVIIGAVHIAIPLVGFARDLGFETIVIDPRGTFSVEERFEVLPDRMLSMWPEKAFKSVALTGSTYAVLLTHDPKIDDKALSALLKSQVVYIGALGSRSTHAARRERLLAAGFGEEDLKRIHGPVGLSIGAKSPAEIALSIMAEIVQVRRAQS
jgi:xanthine dehydrogenase accessory factor